jgi:hypothetical protein
MKTIRFITQLFSAFSLLTIFSLNALAAPPTNVGVSDQKAGSVLVFPYYRSDAVITTINTRITISNTGATTTRVHLFFVDDSCAQADMPICLTANASTSFLVSEMDPSNTGYLIAVAIDENGCPIPQNGLIGNAFVNDGNYVGNYGAEAFWAYGTNMASCDTVNMIATLNFNVLNCVGTGLDALPSQFVAEIQSPNNSIGQKLVTVGLTGDLTNGVASTGAAQIGTGIACNDGEKPGSFSSPWGGACQKSFIVDLKTPRVPGGLGSLLPAVSNPALIPSGRTGTLKWNVAGAVGLIMTPPTGTNKWSGIRTLHKTNAAVGTLVIPATPASCNAVPTP